MPWVGEITSVDLTRNGNEWRIGVKYYDTDEPAVSIERHLQLPLSSTRADVRRAIKQLGEVVRSESELRFQNAVGVKVPLT